MSSSEPPAKRWKQSSLLSFARNTVSGINQLKNILIFLFSSVLCDVVMHVFASLLSACRRSALPPIH